MRGRSASLSGCLLTVLAALVVPQAGGAAPAADPVAGLQEEKPPLASRSRGGVLGLYALDSRVSRVRAQLRSLHSRAERLEREQAHLGRQLRAARQTLKLSERRLARSLHTAYVRGDVDPVAVLLGAGSLEDAIDTLDSLDRAADQGRAAVEQTLKARRRLRALAGRIAGRRADVGDAAAAVARRAAELEAARAARIGYLAALGRRDQLDSREVAALARSAAAAQSKAATVAAAAPAATPAPAAGRRLTVVATGYSVGGPTATGVPTGLGVVAVDPAVIPLGTRMTIPGYGAGIAADTGSGVRGRLVDLWFPSAARARAWGRRVVTVTLH